MSAATFNYEEPPKDGKCVGISNTVEEFVDKFCEKVKAGRKITLAYQRPLQAT